MSTSFSFVSPRGRVLLDAESRCTHAHAMTAYLFESRPLQAESGGLDAARIRGAIEQVLHRVPRYRRRLMWTPLTKRPAWVDDAAFDPRFHIRHVALPRPGGMSQLETLAGRLMEQHLDRSRPLWQVWLVEGLPGDRCALLHKTHHALFEGAPEPDLMSALLTEKSETSEPSKGAFVPAPVPGDLELMRAEALARLAQPIEPLRSMAQAALTRTSGAMRDLGRGLGLRAGTAPALRGLPGPHRRVRWTRTPLSELRGVRTALGGHVLDVALALLTGALRDLLRERGARCVGFPVSIPVASEHGGVVCRRVELPVEEPDPLRRFAEIRAAAGAEYARGQARSIAELERQGPANAARLSLCADVVSDDELVPVIDVPGPSSARYLLGARLIEAHPLAPLGARTPLAISMLTYDGYAHWGCNADFDLIPDLDVLACGIGASLDELRSALARGTRPAA
jgi:WS/DGAT/MGAT family acyltransferase